MMKLGLDWKNYTADILFSIFVATAAATVVCLFAIISKWFLLLLIPITLAAIKSYQLFKEEKNDKKN